MTINNLVETHCHILPQIDDGAKDLETSINMVKRLQEQGAKKIVLTPHYYSDMISLDDFLSKRKKAFDSLLNALPSGSPELILGAEVYITNYLFHNQNLDELKIANSNYILIEHPFSSNFDEEDYNRLMNLYCDYGARPILAHIERYKALMDSPQKIEDYIDMGCLIQVNINSFAQAPRSIKRKLFKFVNNGLIQLIGSDAHNLDSRPPEYESGINAIIKKCGEGAINELIQNANNLVK